MNPKPISEKSRPEGCLRVGLGLFGLIFLGAGLTAFWLIAVYPMLRWNQAKQWIEVDCRVLSSNIVEHHDDDGSSYKPEITYEYRVEGKVHISDQVDFMDFSGSRKLVTKITRQFPKGAQSICFYDPNHHANSILLRDSPLSFWMLFPFPFLLVGGVVLYLAISGKIEPSKSRIRQRIRQKMEDGSFRPGLAQTGSRPAVSFDVDLVYEADQEDQRWDKPQKLKPKTTKIQKLIVAGFIAAFWNGIVSVFVGAMITGEFGRGGQTICFGLFLTPFVLVGLGMIGYFFHTLLSMFNPKVEIAMSSGTVPLGGTVEIAWECSGSVNRIRQLEISIVGTESATYVRGTSTYTDNEVFCKLFVLDSKTSDEMRFGNNSIKIPATSMHTFEADNNQVKWSVDVHGKIPRWPDVKESFPFRVKPLA